MSTVTIALIIDSSGSMGYAGYLPYALTDACTFVNIMQNNDNCTVIQFQNTASVVQNLLSLSNQGTKDSVCTAIQAVTSSGLTNISDAIAKANSQIGTAANPKAMVLLSDGDWNQGSDPTQNLPSIPIYTIALGNNGQLAVLQQIATLTSGKYNFAPGYRQLAQIYNTMVNQTQVARSVVNELDLVGSNNYKEIPAVVNSGTQSGTFTVNWDNTAITYTPNTPAGTQLNVVLIDPNGLQSLGSPVYNQGTTVVFNVPNPVAGTWNIGCWYAGSPGDAGVNCVSAAFVPCGSVQLNVLMENAAVSAGDPFHVKAHLLENGAPVFHPKISIRIDAPLEDTDTLQEKYHAQLNSLTVDPEHTDPNKNTIYTKLISLEKELGTEIFTRTRYPMFPALQDDGSHHLTVKNTSVKGGYLVHVVATGISPATGEIIQSTEIVSFLSR